MYLGVVEGAVVAEALLTFPVGMALAVGRAPWLEFLLEKRGLLRRRRLLGGDRCRRPRASCRWSAVGSGRGCLPFRRLKAGQAAAEHAYDAVDAAFGNEAPQARERRRGGRLYVCWREDRVGDAQCLALLRDVREVVVDVAVGVGDQARFYGYFLRGDLNEVKAEVVLRVGLDVVEFALQLPGVPRTVRRRCRCRIPARSAELL